MERLAVEAQAEEGGRAVAVGHVHLRVRQVAQLHLQEHLQQAKASLLNIIIIIISIILIIIILIITRIICEWRGGHNHRPLVGY
jgi:heme/copper-type cytochrome/quinol oxidase subunit 2